MDHAGIHWKFCYLPLVGLAVLELALSGIIFWSESAEEYQARNPNDEQSGGVKDAFEHHFRWLVAGFMFIYMGVEDMFYLSFFS